MLKSSTPFSKIIIDYSNSSVADVTFYFSGYMTPWSATEFKKGSKMRTRLEKIEKSIREVDLLLLPGS